MHRKITVTLLVVAYLGAVAAANLLASSYGPEITPYTAFGLIGFGLITRDRLADAFGYGALRWCAMAALILGGSLIAFLANPDARQVAIASSVAFLASEGAEAVLYYTMRDRPWLERANKSGFIGAAIDSYLFTTIAFGTTWSIIFAQWTAKVGGCLFFSFLLGYVKVRREPADASIDVAGVDA